MTKQNYKDPRGKTIEVPSLGQKMLQRLGERVQIKEGFRVKRENVDCHLMQCKEMELG